MSEYTEKRTVIEDIPTIKRARPVVETQHDQVVHDHRVHEHRGMSGGAVAALVMAAIAVTLVITMLIMNNQQRDQELADERARADAAQQVPSQPLQPQPPQQPPLVVVPPSQPSATPTPPPPAAAPSSAELEVAVTSKLLDDAELRSHIIDVKVADGTVTLSGHVPNDELRLRGERLAMSVKGVRRIVNNIVVQRQP